MKEAEPGDHQHGVKRLVQFLQSAVETEGKCKIEEDSEGGRDEESCMNEEGGRDRQSTKTTLGKPHLF